MSAPGRPGHFGAPTGEAEPSHSAVSAQIDQMAETQQQHGSALLTACQGLSHIMNAASPAAGAASPPAAAQQSQAVRRGRELTDSDRNAARKGVSETEKESQRRSGHLFDNTRIQAMVALRESAASPPRLLPEQYGLDLYIGLLKLTAVPPSTVDSLSAAGLRVNHVLAVFLTELKVTYDGFFGERPLGVRSFG